MEKEQKPNPKGAKTKHKGAKRSVVFGQQRGKNQTPKGQIARAYAHYARTHMANLDGKRKSWQISMAILDGKGAASLAPGWKD